MSIYPFDLQTLISICKANGVRRLGIFGSMARGDYTEASDIDLLVEFSGKVSLLDMVHLKIELEENLNRTVDVVTPSAIDPYMRDNILRELRVIYE